MAFLDRATHLFKKLVLSAWASIILFQLKLRFTVRGPKSVFSSSVLLYVFPAVTIRISAGHRATSDQSVC